MTISDPARFYLVRHRRKHARRYAAIAHAALDPYAVMRALPSTEEVLALIVAEYAYRPTAVAGLFAEYEEDG